MPTIARFVTVTDLFGPKAETSSPAGTNNYITSLHFTRAGSTWSCINVELGKLPDKIRVAAVSTAPGHKSLLVSAPPPPPFPAPTESLVQQLPTIPRLTPTAAGKLSGCSRGWCVSYTADAKAPRSDLLQDNSISHLLTIPRTKD